MCHLVQNSSLKTSYILSGTSNYFTLIVRISNKFLLKILQNPLVITLTKTALEFLQIKSFETKLKGTFSDLLNRCFASFLTNIISKGNVEFFHFDFH